MNWQKSFDDDRVNNERAGKKAIFRGLSEIYTSIVMAYLRVNYGFRKGHEIEQKGRSF